MSRPYDAVAAALAGRYSVERELGRGGMATVFLARDLKHGRPVAIKGLHPELAAALGPERFLREIETAARLTHPHILPLHDSGSADGLLYYVMPFVEGESLRDRLTRETQLPLDDALRIARDVAAALAYAHSHGVIHRDIKPDNILLSGGEAVVADFGIARAIEAAGGERLTETGLAMGTVAYMSPEQAAGERGLDARSDIYSLGCLLYVLAGEPPFTGPTAQAIMAKRLSEPVPSLHAVRETVPSHIEQAIARALARAPADRFATAAQFAAALEAGARASPVPRRPSRRTIGAVTGAAILVGLTAALLSRRSGRGGLPLDPNLLAVAPFEVLDPKLELWREGLVDVLSRNLDGAGPLRTVSPTVVVRRWRGRADPASAAELGRRTGARLVVYGQLLSEGAETARLRASLLDVATGKVLAELEPPDQADRIDRLADSLTVGFLRALGRTAPGARIRLGSVGTRSLPALKAFLQGEQFYRRFSLDSAVDSYQRATALDSTFALALRREGQTRGWRGDPDYFSFFFSLILQAGRHNHGYAPRDSLLIVADSLYAASGDSLNPAYWSHLQRGFSAQSEAARLYPDDPEVWYQLGESRYHQSVASGATWAQARDAFDRAIALDSSFAPAYIHPVEIALSVGLPAEAQRYLDSYRALALGIPEGAGLRLAAALLDQRSSPAPETDRWLDTASSNVLLYAYLALRQWPDSAESALRLFRLLARGRRGIGFWADSAAINTFFPLSLPLIFRGHVHEAHKFLGNGFSEALVQLAFLGLVPPDSVTAVTTRWLMTPQDLPSTLQYALCGKTVAAVQWLAWRRDTTTLLTLVRRGDSGSRSAANASKVNRLRDVGLGMAALALAQGDTAQAVRRFLTFPDSLCPSDELVLARFRLLAATRHDREAADLLDRHDWIRDPLTKLERGRIADRLGDRETAIRWYQFVVDMWRNADPELQPYRAEAKAALARLGGEPKP